MPVVVPPPAGATSSPQTVATQQVFDYIVDTAGKAITGARVIATLNYTQASDLNPIVEIGPITQSTTTDNNGYWTFNLIPNASLTPSGTLYTIQTPYTNYAISVPASGGAFQSTQILANTPAVLSPAVTGLVGPITVTGDETITGNLTVQTNTTLAAVTEGATTVGGDLTIQSAFRLLLQAAASKLVPGATSFSVRDHADANDNLLVTNAGAVTTRSDFTSGARLLFSTAISKIVAGATSLSLRNNADSADNLILTDAGLVTLRNALSIPPSAGGTVATSSYGSTTVKIAEQVLGSAAASVTFASIPTTFRHLILEWSALTDQATSQPVVFQANGDTGNNYDLLGVSTVNALAPANVSATSVANGQIGRVGVLSGGGTAKFLHANTTTTLRKIVVSQSYEVSAAGTYESDVLTSEWGNTTAAINSIKIFPGAGNFVANSIFTLYGVP